MGTYNHGLRLFAPSARLPGLSHPELRTDAARVGPRRCLVRVIFLSLLCTAFQAGAEERPVDELAAAFPRDIGVFLGKYCTSCHGEPKQEAKLDLRPFKSVESVLRDFAHWELVTRRVAAGDMPPEDVEVRPTGTERDRFTAWSRTLRRREAERTAGDPGPVLARRLSNAEFDNTIRDLTSVDLHPTREFPVDAANLAGFDNSGESLGMTPALLKKYLAAARHVSDHLVMAPNGVAFANHPVVTDSDRDKYCVRRIIDFYQRFQVDYADYLLAAWRYHHRAELGHPAATIEQLSAEARLSARYLRRIIAGLDGEFALGPAAWLRAAWQSLPSPANADEDAVRKACVKLRDELLQARRELAYRSTAGAAKGLSTAAQTMVLWKNRDQAAHRMSYPGGRLVHAARFALKWEEPTAVTIHLSVNDGGDGPTNDTVVWQQPRWNRTDVAELVTLRSLLEKHAPQQAATLKFGVGPADTTIDADSFVMRAPSSLTIRLPKEALFADEEATWQFEVSGALAPIEQAQGAVQIHCDLATRRPPSQFWPDQPVVLRPHDPTAARFEQAYAHFCETFPDTFVVTERSWGVDVAAGGQGRLLSAGFHLMQGFFRDDRPLCELVLDAEQQKQLDELWDELNCVTQAPLRQYKDFIFFERAEPPRFIGEAEFDYARSEDKDSTSPAKLNRLRTDYLAKAERVGLEPAARDALRLYFDEMSAAIRTSESQRIAAERPHRSWLLDFAQRAYRRPLQPMERDELLDFYRTRREVEGLSHDDAMRDTVTRILLSPAFCYRVDPAEAGAHDRPLNDFALASRLSYFLWASMPDEPLLARAAAGELRKPEVLIAQTRRMLRDARVRGWATEFGGSWLDFKRFDQHNAVDRTRYPQFTDELRNAMFEEPIRYLIDLAQSNRSVLDLIEGRDTFVNPVLARHYGMPLEKAVGDAWWHVDDASAFGRGGLLPMAVFLTKQSPGLRTSPVKRGYWVVRRLLDEEIPAPPPNVPELPKDEADLGALTLPQLLARHRDDKNCSACHRRFDALGLAFEGFGPIGEQRTRDLGGRPIEDRVEFPDSSTGQGVGGLRDYLRRARRSDYIDTFCRKMLSYALGRSLQLSDELTVEALRQQINAGDDRFGSIVERIVTSPQFTRKRGRAAE